VWALCELHGCGIATQILRCVAANAAAPPLRMTPRLRGRARAGHSQFSHPSAQEHRQSPHPSKNEECGTRKIVGSLGTMACVGALRIARMRNLHTDSSLRCGQRRRPSAQNDTAFVGAHEGVMACTRSAAERPQAQGPALHKLSGTRGRGAGYEGVTAQSANREIGVPGGN
jgi:hypothetical protein